MTEASPTVAPVSAPEQPLREQTTAPASDSPAGPAVATELQVAPTAPLPSDSQILDIEAHDSPGEALGRSAPVADLVAGNSGSAEVATFAKTDDDTIIATPVEESMDSGDKSGSNAGPPTADGVLELTSVQKAVSIASLATGLALYSLDTTMVATALPTIVRELGGEDLLSWVGTAYLLTSTALGPLWGKLGDIVGRKNLLIGNTALFLLASIMCAMAPSMIVLIIGRGIQGLGGGGVQSLVYVAISEVVTLRERGKYQAILSAIAGGMGIIGPFLGGVITDKWSWRGCFWINIPVCVIAIIGYVFVLKLRPPQSKKASEMVRRIDWGGAAFCITGVTLFLLGLTWSLTSGWGSARCLGPLLAGVACMVGFVLFEWKVPKEPAVPLALFTIRNFAISCVASFCIGYGMTGGSYYMPLYFQFVLGNSPTESGVKTIPWVAALIPVSMMCGIVSSKTGKYVFFPKVGMALAAIAMGLMSLWGMNTGLGEQIGYMVLLGVGCGMSLSMLSLTIQASVPVKDIAPGTTFGAFVRSIGGVVGIGIGGTVMQQVLVAELSTSWIAQIARRVGVSLQTMQKIIRDIINEVNIVPSNTITQTAIDAGRLAVKEAYAVSLSKVFLSLAPVIALGWCVVLFLKHTPLRGKPGAAPPKPDIKTIEQLGTDAEVKLEMDSAMKKQTV